MTRRPRRPKKTAPRMSETAWAGTHRHKRKQTYLEFVRNMRWYTIDARSYLMQKINRMRGAGS